MFLSIVECLLAPDREGARRLPSAAQRRRQQRKLPPPRAILGIVASLALSAAALAQSLVTPIKNASLTGTVTSASITVGGTITINKSPMSAILTQAETTPSSGGVAAKELLIIAGGQYSNVVAIQNPAADGLSAYTARTNTGAEVLALGHGNPSTGMWSNTNYWENESVNTTDPPPLWQMTADGNYGPIANPIVGGTIKLYRRMEMTWNAVNSASEFNIRQLMPWFDGTEQKLSFQVATGAVSAFSGGEPYVKVITTDGDCAVQFFKTQSTLTKVVGVGNSVPGVGVTDDLCFSAYNASGGGWRETMRMNNAGTILSFGGQTTSQPAFKISGTTLKARLADDSADAPFTTGTLTIGGGTALLKMLSVTATLDFSSTSAQSSADLTVTVTGAAVGDTVALGVPNASVSANSSFTAWVSATNTVTVRFNNYSSGAIDPASGSFRATVVRF
jgi:hypothetical protein